RVWCSAPADAVRNWTLKPAPGGTLLAGKPANLLLVELQPPFELKRGREAPTLSVQLRWRGASLPSAWRDGRQPPAWSAALPAVVPANATSIDGGLAIDWDEELFDASFVPALARHGEKVPAEGPWGLNTPDVWLPWRGQPPSGAL